MSYSIKVDHQNKLIRYRHSGQIKIEDIGKAWDEFLKLKEFTEQGYNLLSDYRDGVFDMKIETVYEIVQILVPLKPILSGKKQSMILGDPYSTAGSMLFENEVYEKVGFLVKVFSTKKAAMDWVMR